VRRLLRGRVVKGLSVLFLTCLLLVGGSLASIYYGMLLHERKVADSFSTFFENVIETRLRIVPNWLAGQLQGRPDRLTIDVAHKDFQRLAYKREQAIERGILLTSSDDYVSAKIRHGEDTLPVKLRLKGDWIDHLQGAKWSFRVKVRGADTLFGLKQFSLHHPKTRNFVYEWIYHRALEREGIVSLRYRFVDVVLNGKSLGIYALEEHFEKRLVENARHREGPILRLDENLHWQDLAAHGRKGSESPTGLQAQRASFTDTFKTTSVLGDPVQHRHFDTGRSLLEGLRAGALPPSKVFDVEKLATFFALSDLLGAPHGAVWFNLRFYYNPVTSLLEPVGFDGNAGERLVQLLGSSRDGELSSPRLKDLCFADADFFAEYVQALERVSERAYLDDLLADLDEELRANLHILHREFPWLHYSPRVFTRNQETIRSALHPAKGLHAHYGGAENGTLRLELGNIQSLPVEVLGVELDGDLVYRPVGRLVVRPSKPSSRVEYTTAELHASAGATPASERLSELRLRYRLLGAREARSDAVFPWSRRLPALETETLRLAPNADSFEFLALDESTATFFVRPGHWRLDRDLRIPPGYRVVASSGTHLDLANGAKIVSRSPLELRGSEDDPVVISSEDGTGQGLLVLGAGAGSRLHHVVFRNLAAPATAGWELTGAVTFYESDVEIAHAAFLQGRAEDGLNVIRSEFQIEDTLFDESASDAFDSDFSNGSMVRTTFVSIGNDAVDVSGSEVRLEDLRISGAGDKAVSAGEASRVEVDGLDVRNVGLALASKDHSEVRGRGLSVDTSKIGIVAFQKKPEFGPASIELEDTTLRQVATPYLVEEGSSVDVNGRTIPAIESGLKALLYGVKGG